MVEYRNIDPRQVNQPSGDPSLAKPGLRFTTHIERMMKKRGEADRAVTGTTPWHNPHQDYDICADRRACIFPLHPRKRANQD